MLESLFVIRSFYDLISVSLSAVTLYQESSLRCLHLNKYDIKLSKSPRSSLLLFLFFLGSVGPGSTLGHWVRRLVPPIYPVPLRFLKLAVYHVFRKHLLIALGSFERLVKVATFLNVIENIALLGLSFVSSKDNYGVHKGFFITFIICSEVYMLLTYYLLKDIQNRLTNPNERLAFRRKKQLLCVNIGCFLIALYFFYRHNTYCEEGIYTMFALFEYIVVLSNMGFHMAAYYDFYHHHLTVGEIKMTSSY
ncbi:unnamed protein product, partial [Meganyctiphanes norvegica]